jgi:hypothetical protein
MRLFTVIVRVGSQCQGTPNGTNQSFHFQAITSDTNGRTKLLCSPPFTGTREGWGTRFRDDLEIHFQRLDPSVLVFFLLVLILVILVVVVILI